MQLANFLTEKDTELNCTRKTFVRDYQIVRVRKESKVTEGAGGGGVLLLFLHVCVGVWVRERE